MTEQALEVIRRSLELAKADPAEMGVRLRLAGGAIRPRFAPEPSPGDEVVETGGVRIFVASNILTGDIAAGDIEIGVSDEHESLVVRPLGSS